MTNPYSARYVTAFDYFKDAVFDNYKTKIEYGDNNEKLFKKFYKFIDNEMETSYFLAHSSKKMINY
jgi:hypothetical protein